MNNDEEHTFETNSATTHWVECSCKWRSGVYDDDERAWSDYAKHSQNSLNPIGDWYYVHLNLHKKLEEKLNSE